MDRNVLIDDDGKSTYLCTDSERKVFTGFARSAMPKYKDEAGNTHKDIEALTLTKELIDAGLVKQAQQVCLNWCFNLDGSVDEAKKLYMLGKLEDIRNMRYNNSTFSKELSARKV